MIKTHLIEIFPLSRYQMGLSVSIDGCKALFRGFNGVKGGVISKFSYPL